VYPVANFSSNPTEGYAPLDVEFTDSSEMQPSGSGTLEMETVQLTRMQHILIQQQEAMKLTLQ
jgi:hypothetical protein